MNLRLNVHFRFVCEVVLIIGSLLESAISLLDSVTTVSQKSSRTYEIGKLEDLVPFAKRRQRKITAHGSHVIGDLIDLGQRCLIT